MWFFINCLLFYRGDCFSCGRRFRGQWYPRRRYHRGLGLPDNLWRSQEEDEQWVFFYEVSSKLLVNHKQNSPFQLRKSPRPRASHYCLNSHYLRKVNFFWKIANIIEQNPENLYIPRSGQGKQRTPVQVSLAIVSSVHESVLALIVQVVHHRHGRELAALEWAELVSVCHRTGWGRRRGRPSGRTGWADQDQRPVLGTLQPAPSGVWWLRTLPCASPWWRRSWWIFGFGTTISVSHTEKCNKFTQQNKRE